MDLMQETDETKPSQSLPIKRDLILMVTGTMVSFLSMYARGLFHRPDAVQTVAFVWPLLSFTFLINAAFICIGLPLFHFLYTFPAYFVRAWLGRSLRTLLKLVLITFPFFLLNGKVAYLVNDDNGTHLVRNDGSTVALVTPAFEISGDGLNSYVFTVNGERLYTFAFLKSEMPRIDANKAMDSDKK
jgi:hypothetical protein